MRRSMSRMETGNACPSQPAAVSQDSSVALAAEAPGEHISTGAFQAKLRCHVAMAYSEEGVLENQQVFIVPV